MATISLLFLVFCILVVDKGADSCTVYDEFLKRNVYILQCGSTKSDPSVCKSKSGEVDAFSYINRPGKAPKKDKCVKCKVPNSPCTKHEDCCWGDQKRRGTCLAGKCTVCSFAGSICHKDSPLCCETETNDEIQCRAIYRESNKNGEIEYHCKEDSCKKGGATGYKYNAVCRVDGFAGVLQLCDCPTEKFTSMECRGESCRTCKRYLAPCTTKSDCCDEMDCDDGKCKPKCLPAHAFCNKTISCCGKLSCKKDTFGNHQCFQY